jgi:hypothetical protein
MDHDGFTCTASPEICTEPEFVNLSRSPGIDSQPGGPVRQLYLFDAPARQAIKAGGIDSWAP